MEITIRRLLSWLRIEFPLLPGYGRVRYYNRDDGRCGYVTEAGSIYINRRELPHMQRETVLHEWAHLRVGWKDKDHTLEFWKECGRINNAYQQWKESLQ